MIKSFPIKGYKKALLRTTIRASTGKDVERIKLRLLMLDEATTTEDFRAYPGFKFHPLKGDKKNLYAITVPVRTGESP